eukprot:4561110-Prymnesium_polylepis.1
MEDAWATPLPSRSTLLRLVEARAERQPLPAFRGVRCGSQTTFPRLVCIITSRWRTVWMGCVSSAS